MLVGRECILDTHHELDMGSRRHQAGIDQSFGAVNVRQVEDFNLRRDPELLHFRCQIEHQPRRVLVHNRGKIGRTGRERGHIRPMVERKTARPDRALGHLSRTARSCPGSACALRPALRRTGRDSRKKTRRRCVHGYAPAQHLPRMPREWTRSAQRATQEAPDCLSCVGESL